MRQQSDRHGADLHNAHTSQHRDSAAYISDALVHKGKQKGVRRTARLVAILGGVNSGREMIPRGIVHFPTHLSNARCCGSRQLSCQLDTGWYSCCNTLSLDSSKPVWRIEPWNTSSRTSVGSGT
eukprot:scaffold266352_cov77-Attheya_sp.AAC.1